MQFTLPIVPNQRADMSFKAKTKAVCKKINKNKNKGECYNFIKFNRIKKEPKHFKEFRAIKCDNSAILPVQVFTHICTYIFVRM